MCGEMTFVGEPFLEHTGPLFNRIKSFIHAIRCAWSGLPTILLEGEKEITTPCLIEDSELAEFLPASLKVAAGFTLTSPGDPLYKRFLSHKLRFGKLLHRAAVALRESDVDDHIDATLAVSRAIDVYLLEYGITASAFNVLNKSYVMIREYVRFVLNFHLLIIPSAGCSAYGPNLNSYLALFC